MNQIASKSNLKSNKNVKVCAHCGDPCLEKLINKGQKNFCCEGCKMVYTILNENNLGNYYSLNTNAGVSQKYKSNTAYAFLEDEDAIRRLIDFKDEVRTKISFHLPQIHCSACLWLLENLHRLHSGVQQSRVDFLKKEVSITFSNEDLSLRELAELLDKIGYPPSINFNDLDDDRKTVINSTLYYKLGLAGFAFGNIMLLSFPEYLGMDIKNNALFVQFFGYLNILLSLPLVFYSGWDYLQSAWTGLKQKHLNIDVPVSLGILALFFRSIFEILSHTGAGYMDSLAGLIFFLLIGKWFQKSTYAKLSFDRDYKSYFPIASTLKKDGKESPITLDKIKHGDKIIIRHGELIPADAILLDGTAKIDYSFVTGESELVEKQKGNQLYAGGKHLGSMIEISIIKKVSNSYLTQLWNEDTFSKSNVSGDATILADKVAGFFTILILSVALLTLLYWLPKDFGIAINAFTAVLIVACPCAVALSIPFTFGNVIRLLAQQKIYLKNTSVIEALSRINHIVFDKTGTITTVNNGHMSYEGELLSTKEKEWIFSLVHHSTHPLSRRIKASLNVVNPLEVKSFKEIKGQGLSGQVEEHFIRIGSPFFIQKNSNEKTLQQNVLIEIDGQLRGAYTYKGQYREGLKTFSTT